MEYLVLLIAVILIIATPILFYKASQVTVFEYRNQKAKQRFEIAFRYLASLICMNFLLGKLIPAELFFYQQFFLTVFSIVFASLYTFKTREIPFLQQAFVCIAAFFIMFQIFSSVNALISTLSIFWLSIGYAILDFWFEKKRPSEISIENTI